MKRIVICSDGTWNRPEKDLKEDVPTNVLKLARAIKPNSDRGVAQQVFYDWGVGSYYDMIIGGATGKGIEKNITDGYRYIVQNYSPGDELFFFGFSRGAYTVRALCGLIHNCGILKRPEAALIEKAFEHYKNPGPAYGPSAQKSIDFRDIYSHPSRDVAFVGVWDTVGALGIPVSFLGLFDVEDEFYDTKIGPNIRVARHALAIDEFRSDFEPTIWKSREEVDIRQVWFAGSHSDVGGGNKPDKDGRVLSDGPLSWMLQQAEEHGLEIEPHIVDDLSINPLAKIHKSRKRFYRVRGKLFRPIAHGSGEILIHSSVKQRWDQDMTYRPGNLVEYVAERGWQNLVA